MDAPPAVHPGSVAQEPPTPRHRSARAELTAARHGRPVSQRPRVSMGMNSLSSSSSAWPLAACRLLVAACLLSCPTGAGGQARPPPPSPVVAPPPAAVTPPPGVIGFCGPWSFANKTESNSCSIYMDIGYRLQASTTTASSSCASTVAGGTCTGDTVLYMYPNSSNYDPALAVNGGQTSAITFQDDCGGTATCSGWPASAASAAPYSVRSCCAGRAVCDI